MALLLGDMILFANTGLGKTNLAMAASGHIGAGKDFLHWHMRVVVVKTCPSSKSGSGRTRASHCWVVSGVSVKSIALAGSCRGDARRQILLAVAQGLDPIGDVFAFGNVGVARDAHVAKLDSAAPALRCVRGRPRRCPRAARPGAPRARAARR